MRRRTWIIIGLIVTLMVAAIIVVPTVANYLDNETSTNNVVQSNWYDFSWLYREPITINNTGTALTNYQIQLSLNLSSLIPSHMLASGNDIRFTSSDGQTPLSYWIESISTPSAAVIWVKVPSILGNPSTTTIYMYYGNSVAAAASSGDNTFIFFDDFETYPFTKWTVVGNSSPFIQSNAQVQHGSNSAYFNKQDNTTVTVTSSTFTNTDNPVIVEYYIRPSYNNRPLQTKIQRSASVGPEIQLGNANIQYTTNGSAFSNISAPSGYSATTWYNIQLNNINYSNNTYAIWVAGVQHNTGVAYVTALSNPINQIVFTASGTGTGNQSKAYIDLVKVRVYVQTPPTLGTQGAEE